MAEPSSNSTIGNTPGIVSAEAKESRWSVGMRALKHRNFQLFFSGQLISLTGTWMQTVAQSWLVYRLTGSSLLLGSVGFASQIPVFLMAPVGGMAADRFNRQRIVIATQVASMILAIVLALLTLTHMVKVWHIFVLAALLGVVNAFDIPGRQSFLVDMVGREDLVGNGQLTLGDDVEEPPAGGRAEETEVSDYPGEIERVPQPEREPVYAEVSAAPQE